MSLARVLIVDDHVLVAEGLRRLIEPEFDVAGVLPSGDGLMEEVERLRPDLLVLDIGMPGMNGLEAAQKLSRSQYRPIIVIVTQQGDRHYVRAALRAGASAYVLKQSAPAELVSALHKALAGETYVCNPLAQEMEFATEGPQPKELTERQREVLRLVAEGKSAKEIAAALGISTKTAEFHRASIMDRLGLRTTAELTRYAVGIGLISV